MEHDTRLELATDAWKAPMLPLHQSCERRTEARLKEGGIYIAFILYHFFLFLSNFSFEKIFSRAYAISAYSVAGEHVLPTTLAAHISRFSYPHQSLLAQGPREYLPQPEPRFVLASWVSPTPQPRKGYLYQ